MADDDADDDDNSDHDDNPLELECGGARARAVPRPAACVAGNPFIMLEPVSKPHWLASMTTMTTPPSSDCQVSNLEIRHQSWGRIIALLRAKLKAELVCCAAV